MQRRFAFALGLTALFCTAAQAQFSYAKVDAAGIVITGIRSDSSSTDAVVITSSVVLNGITYGGLYQGSLAAAAAAPLSQWKTLTPVFAGEDVTSATFYGPNTSRFDPSLGAGNVRAVGSYKFGGGLGSALDHGMMYAGPVTGGGTWTKLDAKPLVTAGDTLKNTIAHSNMGSLVVGNYDTSLVAGKAFIYNIADNAWIDLNPFGSKSVTAYGIWQNGGSASTTYTIAGGYSDLNDKGLDNGYLLDYDTSTGVGDLRGFTFDNAPISSLISHFDGITGTADGYHLTGDFLKGSSAGAFLASVGRLPDGSFGPASWQEVAYPGAELTSGNTVVDNTVLGIYVAGGTTHSYLATAVPEPKTWAVMVAGLLGLAGLRRLQARRRS
jgi:hypothetical protein